MEKLYGKQLEIMATKARLLGLDAVHTAASGHIGGSLSAMDILTTLYFNVMHVDPANPQDPDRDRKLLLHAREIKLLAAQTEQKGLTVVPVKLYFKQGKIKMEIALARGRKLHDQREELKRRAETRDLERELARR